MTVISAAPNATSQTNPKIVLPGKSWLRTDRHDQQNPGLISLEDRQAARPDGFEK
jgi:hypothetical protein